MAVKIKIGALSRLEEVDIVNELKPDFAGVDLCNRYKHGIDIEQAKAIRRRLDPNIPLVGMFVNDRYMDVLVALRQGVIDIAQLQGTESEEFIRDLKFMSRKPVIKACQVESPDVIPAVLNSSADLLLFGVEPDTETIFDWSLLRNVERPFILSGGLNPDNIAHAIEVVRPWGVNLITGFETDGVKDRAKLIAAFEAAHRFD